MSPRAWIAAAVIAVGGTLWIWLPGPSVREGGPLQEATGGFGRFHVPPGRSRVEWVLLTNTGHRPVRLSSAKLGQPLRGGARVIGTAVRDGLTVGVGVKWPSPVPGVFHPVDGYMVAPGASVSIAFGLLAPFPVRLRLTGAVIRYRSDGVDYRREARAVVVLCVTRRQRCRAQTA